MKYVVDSSVAFKWVVPEQWSDKAKLLRDDVRNAIYQLLAVDIFPAEIAHGLTRAERQGRIAIPQARILWADVMTIPPAFFPCVALTPRAIDISSRLRIGVYDCLYVALAELEKCDLVTADDKLVNNVQGQFPFVRHLSSLP